MESAKQEEKKKGRDGREREDLIIANYRMTKGPAMTGLFYLRFFTRVAQDFSHHKYINAIFQFGSRRYTYICRTSDIRSLDKRSVI